MISYSCPDRVVGNLYWYAMPRETFTNMDYFNPGMDK